MVVGQVTGAAYLSDEYGASLAALGLPRRLPRSRAWLVLREIPGSAGRDAVAGYRRLVCGDWSGLARDIAEQEDLVSITAVTDAFAPVTRRDLEEAFPDQLRPYKRHFIVELADERPLPQGHRYRLRQALRAVDVTLTPDPTRFADAMLALNSHLADRHGLHGDAQLSAQLVRAQLEVPGSFATVATIDHRCVSMTVWYVMEGVAYYHLAASSPEGYAVSANYALVAAALDHLRSLGVERVDLGSNAGSAGADDGLAAFKRGWSTTTTTAWLGGRVLDRTEYDRLTRLRAAAPGVTDYFPAYRAERR